MKTPKIPLLNKSIPVSELIRSINLYSKCAVRRFNTAKKAEAEGSPWAHAAHIEANTFTFCAADLAEKCGLASFVYSDRKISAQLQPAVEVA